MTINLDEISKLLGDKAEQGWHKDPENKISVVRELLARETDGHHNLICQCNGRNFEGKEDLVDFIAAAPTIIRDLVEDNKRLRGSLRRIVEAPLSECTGNDQFGCIELMSNTAVSALKEST